MFNFYNYTIAIQEPHLASRNAFFVTQLLFRTGKNNCVTKERLKNVTPICWRFCGNITNDVMTKCAITNWRRLVGGRQRN